MRWALGDPPPFILCPQLYISSRQQRPIAESKDNLPTRLGLRRWRHISPDLDYWLRNINWLLDCGPACYTRLGLRRSIARNPRGFLGGAFPFLSLTSRRNLILFSGELKLSRRVGARKKPINSHHSLLYCLTSLDAQGINRLGCFWLSYLGGVFRLSNGHVSFVILRYNFNGCVPYRRKIVCGSILGAKIPSFTNSEQRGEEVLCPTSMNERSGLSTNIAK